MPLLVSSKPLIVFFSKQKLRLSKSGSVFENGNPRNVRIRIIEKKYSFPLNFSSQNDRYRYPPKFSTVIRPTTIELQSLSVFNKLCSTTGVFYKWRAFLKTYHSNMMQCLLRRFRDEHILAANPIQQNVQYTYKQLQFHPITNRCNERLPGFLFISSAHQAHQPHHDYEMLNNSEAQSRQIRKGRGGCFFFLVTFFRLCIFLTAAVDAPSRQSARRARLLSMECPRLTSAFKIVLKIYPLSLSILLFSILLLYHL